MLQRNEARRRHDWDGAAVKRGKLAAVEGCVPGAGKRPQPRVRWVESKMQGKAARIARHGQPQAGAPAHQRARGRDEDEDRPSLEMQRHDWPKSTEEN